MIVRHHAIGCDAGGGFDGGWGWMLDGVMWGWEGRTRTVPVDFDGVEGLGEKKP